MQKVVYTPLCSTLGRLESGSKNSQFELMEELFTARYSWADRNPDKPHILHANSSYLTISVQFGLHRYLRDKISRNFQGPDGKSWLEYSLMPERYVKGGVHIAWIWCRSKPVWDHVRVYLSTEVGPMNTQFLEAGLVLDTKSLSTLETCFAHQPRILWKLHLPNQRSRILDLESFLEYWDNAKEVLSMTLNTQTTSHQWSKETVRFLKPSNAMIGRWVLM